MKRILLVASALLMLVPFANAQLKSSADVKKYVESAKAKADNPKNATKPAVWMKLGEAYYKAYTDATGDVQIGHDETNASLFLQAKPTSQEMVVLDGVQTVKNVYKTVNIYYQNGIVCAVEPTDLAYPDALDLAAEAYAKALTLDPKKEEDIRAALTRIADRLNYSGSSWYTLGNLYRSSVDFEKSYKVSKMIPGGKGDANALYNAGLTASMVGDYNRGAGLFQMVIDEKFDNTADAYARLADCYDHLGKAEEQKATLEAGFAQFPENENILLGLINLSMKEGDPDYVLKLLAQAKEMDPANASLWYVEGNMYAKIKEYDKAVESYRKSVEIDPEYIFGYYAEGLMWATRYDELNDEVTNLPVTTPYATYKKYDAMMEEALIKAVDPLEAAFEKGDKAFKDAIAPMLRTIYYKLSDSGENYMARYEFFEADAAE
ncbi:MAG: tetratricopeptide repeat protein [Bacteroidota bacterium]|nr:tetratricopeptide repeat protein [Bacteroidota bacterium]